MDSVCASARRIEGGKGSLIEIDRVVTGGPAFQEGLRPGTRILGVGEQAGAGENARRVRSRRSTSSI